jgi:hypothetical protein
VSLGSSHVELDVGGPGTYRVAVRWSPYWSTPAGCVAKGADGMVRVHATQAGLINLNFDVNVQNGLETLAGISPSSACPS